MLQEEMLINSVPRLDYVNNSEDLKSVISEGKEIVDTNKYYIIMSTVQNNNIETGVKLNKDNNDKGNKTIRLLRNIGSTAIADFGAPIMAPVSRPYFIFNEDVISAGVQSYYVV